jgi:predicted Fe-S protein YdhL (DUF1289 family)
MTSTEITEQIRKRLNKLHPTETFQDAELWREFTFARSRVLKNQLSRRNKVSELNYHSVCMEMIDVDESECACVLSGCKVKRTRHQIPSYLHYSDQSTLRVMNIKNQVIAQGQENFIEDDILYKPGYNKCSVATIRNGYVYIYNSEIEQIVINAIWANPLELLFIQKCVTKSCLSDSKELIQISEELMLDMMNIVTQSLMTSIQLPTNETTDNNEKT